MRDDLLQQQLLDYARAAAEEAAQPDAGAIRRRARRHYRRLAALTVAAALLVVGLGVGLGLGRDPGAPTVTQPTPVQPAPTRPRPGPVPPPSRPPAAGKLPATFAGSLANRVAVVSTKGGRLVRALTPALPGVRSYAVGTTPDRSAVYFSQEGPDPCADPGVFRVPAGGGRAVQVVAGENAWGPIRVSADGSRLAYLAPRCPSTAQLDVVVRDAAGALVGRWPVAADLTVAHVSLSPDGRSLAVSISRNLQLLGVRMLDVAGDRSIADGRLIRAPERGCALAIAEFQPGTGRLAAFERCLPGGPQSSVPPQFRLVYLDPDGGRLRSRSFSFEDRSGADLHVPTMDFDQSGRHLLYTVSSADPADYRLPGPPTGTWRSSDGTRPVRIPDDRRLPGAGEPLTTASPSW